MFVDADLPNPRGSYLVIGGEHSVKSLAGHNVYHGGIFCTIMIVRSPNNEKRYRFTDCQEHGRKCTREP
jgi:hypothetical protein